MTLNKLLSTLNKRLAGRPSEFSWIDKADGSQIAAVHVDGKLFATWEAQLANKPVFDGVTPRGPRDYRGLKFFDGPAGTN
jgi:hypothetical protein